MSETWNVSKDISGEQLTVPRLVGRASVALPDLEGVAGDLLSVGVVNAEIELGALDLDVVSGERGGGERGGGERDSGEESSEHCESVYGVLSERRVESWVSVA